MRETPPPASRRPPRTRRVRPGAAVLGLCVAALLGVAAVLRDAAADGGGGAPAPERSWVRVVEAADGLIEARLAEAKVEPAPRSDDAEFLRRVHLDLTGTVPTGEEAEAFARDASPQKRLLKVEELLASPAYADYWGTWWFRTLTGLTGGAVRNGMGARLLRGPNGEAFREWLHDQVEANRPYDEMVRDLIASTGRTDENGATGFYARWDGKPNELAGAVAKTFLGLRIQCAQCHDHVYETEWKQKDFQGMASFFLQAFPQRVPLKDADAMRPGLYASDVRDLDAPGDAGRRRLAAAARRQRELPEELKQRVDLADVTPKLWMGPEAPDLAGIPRRMLLARWVTSPRNPWFAKALVNRMWGHFLGRGIVHPVDDFGSFNTPSHPQLLDLLAEDFAGSGFDLKRLARILVATDAYQRTSRGSGETEPDPSLFARAAVRPLSTEQLYLSLARASGLDARLDRLGRREARQDQQRLFAAFSFVFEDDEMTEAQDFAGSIPQGLFLMNGPLAQLAVGASPRAGPRARRGAADGTVARAVETAKRSPKEAVRTLWLAAYGRPPEPAETNRALGFVGRGDGAEPWQDLFWTLLNSAEFTTNH